VAHYDGGVGDEQGFVGGVGFSEVVNFFYIGNQHDRHPTPLANPEHMARLQPLRPWINLNLQFAPCFFLEEMLS
jgi:hypothetical protein